MSQSLDQIRDYMLENKELFEEWINILLVWTGGRKATLIETANWSNKDLDMEASLEIIFKFVDLLNSYNLNLNHLYIIHDKFSYLKYPRYFISNINLKNSPKSDKEIGMLLGFRCYDHNYSNYYKDRISYSVNALVGDVEEYQISTEVCEEEKLDEKEMREYYQDKIDIWNKCMEKIDFKITFRYFSNKVLGIDNLLKKVMKDDVNFIQNHSDEYSNYFDNFSTEPLTFLFDNNFRDEGEIKKRLKLLKWMMWLSYPDPETHESIINDINSDSDFQINLLKKLVKSGKEPENLKQIQKLIQKLIRKN